MFFLQSFLSRSPSEPDSIHLNKCLVQLATRHRAVKFCAIRAQEAIRNFPISKCPTILVYYNTTIIKQYEKLHAFGGSNKTTPDSIEWVLSQPFSVVPNGGDGREIECKILNTQLRSNPADQANKLTVLKGRGRGGGGRGDSDDDDDSD